MATTFTVALLPYFILLSLLSFTEADVLGFSADLIHIDSHKSPLYDPSLTHLDRMHNALRRSHNRLKHLASVSKHVHSTSSIITPSSGEYLMKISLGTPPFDIFAIVDTGSDITWTQCTPCAKCYKQKAPLFDPKKSSTYKTYPYDSRTCQSLDTRYRSPNNTCEFDVSYDDFSYTRGTLASEVLTLGSNTTRPIYYPRFTFGCGFNNSGSFKEDQAGIVGLGGGPNSLVSQIKPSINAKFSYCLLPNDSKFKLTSKINFGNNAVVSGTRVVSTPIIPKSYKTYYYLNMEAISVGKRRIEFFNSSSAASADAGNTIIDSGSELFYLPIDSYYKLEDLVKEAMGLKPIPDPYSLCYKLSDKLLYPEIKVHLTGGTIDLKPVNTFIKTGKNASCLAFGPNIFDDFAVYGNVAQANFLVGYDTAKKTVSFKPAKCGH